jgi:hypothetical protein
MMIIDLNLIFGILGKLHLDKNKVKINFEFYFLDNQPIKWLQILIQCKKFN